MTCRGRFGTNIPLLMHTFSPAHSLILYASDFVWKDHFTQAELDEIWACNLPKPSELPKEAVDYLHGYDGLVSGKIKLLWAKL